MVYLLKKGIFHGYVKKPDGSDLCLFTFVFFVEVGSPKNLKESFS